ncbi:MAG TPA: ATP-binding cassette domain-containing protein [Thermomicrobiales bacterium]|nr:ATP-binding cassette domain-containing protein [Thermomicrobiales bacterium]
MREPIIEARNLEKRFTIRKHRAGALGALRGLVDRGGTEVAAVKDVSLTIDRGEIVGYIGPNGAGKSTTIKMLTGILVPSGGSATVAGLTPWEQRKQLAGQIGVVFGQRTQLWWDLALLDSLELLRHMYRVPEQRFRENLDHARELLALDDFLRTPVRQLSLGQRMRGDLAAALLHDPQILYLDEPTIGLDIVAKARIRDFLATLNRERHVTILLTTHDLADIEQLCKRIVVIDHGQVMYDGALDALRSRYGTRRQIIVDFDEDPGSGIGHIAGPDLELRAQEGPRVHIAFDGQALSATAVLDRAAAFGTIRDVSIEEPEIEEVIRQMYEGRLAPAS